MLGVHGGRLTHGEPDVVVSDGSVCRVRARADAGAPTRRHCARASARRVSRPQTNVVHAQVADVRRRVEAGERKAQIARDYGISRETLSQYLRSPR